MEATSLRFAAAARALADEARALQLVVPGFRSPPRDAGVDRTIGRGRGGGQPVVSVRVRGRPWSAVLADLIEGVVVANGLAGVEAGACRSGLWEAAERQHLTVIRGSSPTGRGTSRAADPFLAPGSPTSDAEDATVAA
jgi:hypothetical protein